MKKIVLSLLTGVLMVGCANNELIDNPGNNNGEVSTTDSYLTVNIISPSTRATGTDYESGSAQENQVNLVRFYFFDYQGNATSVKQNASTGQWESFIDWDPSDPSEGSSVVTPSNPGTSNGTVEKMLTTTFTIEVPDDVDSNPDLIVAVLNPPTSVTSLGNLSLGDLSQTVGKGIQDFQTGLTNSNFVMSNSVYVDTPATEDGADAPATPQVMNAVDLAGKWNGSLEEALKDENMVNIYVERVVARLDLSITAPQATTVGEVYDTGVTFGDIAGTNKKVYVKFVGWNVTCTPDASRLMKSIDAGWGANLFGNTEAWNNPAFHRSFWAINPKYNSEYGLTLYSYNQLTTSIADGGAGQTVPALSTANSKTWTSVYMQENAADFETAEGSVPGSGPIYPSKVIVAGQLVDAQGNNVEIAEWAFNKYSVPTLLAYFAKASHLYVRTGEAGAYTFTPITASNLTFETYGSYTGNKGVGVVGGYNSYCVINTDTQNGGLASTAVITDSNAQDAEPFANFDAVNKYLETSFGTCMVWAGGMTYYYFDILHLGAQGNPGYMGVVRNHVYDSTIQSLTGIGTPVYDPDEPIYPENPERGNGLIAARINVLMWRIVSQNYDMSW